ncbi:MAG: M23 family metallopeptidase [Deltaproteobacteria bacterium]|nr:M23 family metallopeptidase [Deltaproteobacteria bacterium]
MKFQLIIIFLILLTLAIPVAPIVWLWVGKAKTKAKFDWLLKVLITGAVVFFAFNAGAWVFLSVYLKYALLLLFAFAGIRNFPRNLENRKIFGKRNSKGKISYKLEFVFLALLIILNIFVVKGKGFSGDAVELSFPLKDGRHYVMQGGASRLLNLFHGSGAEKYALDITKLNSYGNRAGGIFPKELSKFNIYGVDLYSPCNGKVIEAVDGLTDNVPGVTDKENPAGNHVSIDCSGVKVLLAHLNNGSIQVNNGAPVKDGQIIGRVGNSGNSLEPHLHIHATRVDEQGSEIPVPMTFNGKFLTMNKIISR